MSENKFIEDDIDRMLYYRIPSSGNCFEGMGALCVIFAQWIKRRSARKQENSKVEQKILIPENKIETIKV